MRFLFQKKSIKAHQPNSALWRGSYNSKFMHPSRVILALNSLLYSNALPFGHFGLHKTLHSVIWKFWNLEDNYQFKAVFLPVPGVEVLLNPCPNSKPPQYFATKFLQPLTNDSLIFLSWNCLVESSLIYLCSCSLFPQGYILYLWSL